ncbi:glycosyltransferase family 4 protein [Amycolatopsis viridis]|uniref:Glycosyltransferase involved in cell wall biosynthesis n=1 Tax=Amycolatopsis viridis TaxID=185678 RepID=A0ABX0T575_9PSEU|nr:glycosyltransferase family 4 protein [Amycolatopsis viridis]NIH83065.1 glycosyltransferase involved in cell wall biosynthesis [Amycolatopsis viridis]
MRGPRGTYPSLTDDRCRHIGWLPDRVPVGSLLVRSSVPAQSPADHDRLTDLVIDLGGGEENIDTYDQLQGLVGKVRRATRFFAPIQYDVARQVRTDIAQRRAATRALPQRQPVAVPRRAGQDPAGRPPAVLFGLHWLEMGGAERWAFDCIRLAKEAGLVPIVVTDRDSSHPWITQLDDDAVVVPMTHPITMGHDAAFLDGIFAAYDVRGVHVHHNTWMYDRLPWIKSVRPDIPVVDSLHILEWRTGGFVDHSVCMSNMIDEHHVISPQLRDYLAGKHGIAASKVRLATLADLTTGDLTHDSALSPHEPFTVTYIGRFHQQKRPYLFLRLAAELKRKSNRPVRFIMHGDGPLAREVHALRSRLNLADVLELRGPDKPVRSTLAESDVMVITSENEGLSLTSFEATAAGVPVVSTDVGSQASLVADDLLCPRHTYPFIRTATRRIETLASSADQRKRWFDEQARKADALRALPAALDWARDLYAGWSRA